MRMYLDLKDFKTLWRRESHVLIVKDFDAEAFKATIVGLPGT